MKRTYRYNLHRMINEYRHPNPYTGEYDKNDSHFICISFEFKGDSYQTGPSLCSPDNFKEELFNVHIRAMKQITHTS